MAPEPLVRASGGVVVRHDGPRARILLVHRPRYDDWTIPKGKLGPGETDEECAVREVEEETNVSCVLGPELPSIRYLDKKGRPKLVRYWLMDGPTPPAEADDFEANDEVDRIRWVELAEARALLSYPRDLEVVAGLTF
ncbi:MAG: NUDIX hydrolase, partial [Actinomycetia bacterium]|nr:NUDIX hydrolase [Actinomycetes bacterium]